MEEWYESSNSQDVEDAFYDSYTGMDGWEGPEYIRRPVGRTARSSKYKYCQQHNHWFSPKYKQCWYCWRGTSKTKENKLNRLATKVGIGESTWPLQ